MKTMTHMLRRPLGLAIALALVVSASAAWANLGFNPPTGIDSNGQGFGNDLASGQQFDGAMTTRLGGFPVTVTLPGGIEVPDVNKAEAFEVAVSLSHDNSADGAENFAAQITCDLESSDRCRACTAGGCVNLDYDVCDSDGEGYVDQAAVGALQACAVEALEPEIELAFGLPQSGRIRVKEVTEVGQFAATGESLILYNFWELVLTHK